MKFVELLYIVAAVFHYALVSAAKTVIHGDICISFPSKKLYLEPGTSGLLYATNVTWNQRMRRASVRREIEKNEVTELDHKWIPHEPFFFKKKNRSAFELFERLFPKVSSIHEILNHRNLLKSSITTNIPIKEFVEENTERNTKDIDGEDSEIYDETLTVSLNKSVTDESISVSEVDGNQMEEDEGEILTSSPIIEDDSDGILFENRDISNSQRDFKSCRVEVYTCPGCHLDISFHEVHLPTCSHDRSCRCDFVKIREPPYLQMSRAGLDVCGELNINQDGERNTSPIRYTTLTKEANMEFFYKNIYSHKAFVLQVTARRNSFIISKDVSSEGIIRSPFFPELYPTDYWIEYIFIGINQTSKVRISFTDFYISPWSYIEIHDNQRTQMKGYSGNIFRPPPLVSAGNRFILRFSANGETDRGFKFHYNFMESTETDKVINSNCGGLVPNIGGTITMLNMTNIADESSAEIYDCVWIIQPPQEYAMKTHLFIRIQQFDKMGLNSNIEVRQGLTSDDYLLERLERTESSQENHKGLEHVVSSDSGFYVRLKGSFLKDSQMSIVYSSFSYLGSCYPLTDFKCQNHRCIPKMLRCDGFDHCSDSSDEPESCYRMYPDIGKDGRINLPISAENISWLYKNTPNYYFPYRRTFLGDHPHSGLILFVSFLFIAVAIIGLIWYVIQNSNRNQSRNTSRRRRRQRLNSYNDGVEIFDASSDDPPNYEAPPDYEQVVKLILSGNNLKLVRRPGGISAWVSTNENTIEPTMELPQITMSAPETQPVDLLSGEEDISLRGDLDIEGVSTSYIPLTPTSVRGSMRSNVYNEGTRSSWMRNSKRRRHASLDLDRKAEIVLWDPNHASTSGNNPSISGETESPVHIRYHPSTPPHLPGQLRRTSMESVVNIELDDYPFPYNNIESSCDQNISVNEDVQADDDNVFLDENNYQASSSVFVEPDVEDIVTDADHQQETLEDEHSDNSHHMELNPTYAASIGSTHTNNDIPDCTPLSENDEIVIRSDDFIRPVLLASIKESEIKKKPNEELLPPSYDSVLKLVLDEFYVTDETYAIDDMQNSIGAQLRARAAREKFQNLCVRPPCLREERDRFQRKFRSSSRRKYITPGTVKRRKALLLKHLENCDCKGDNCKCFGDEKKDVSENLDIGSSEVEDIESRYLKEREEEQQQYTSIDCLLPNPDENLESTSMNTDEQNYYDEDLNVRNPEIFEDIQSFPENFPKSSTVIDNSELLAYKGNVVEEENELKTEIYTIDAESFHTYV